MEPSVKRIFLICVNGSAPLNKMAAMPIYGKKTPVFKPGISVLGPRGPYSPKSWGHLKKSGDSTINNQNFIENVPVAFRCGYFAPCNLFL